MIQIPARFNAATFFVDRHLAEGRGGRIAFFHDGGSLTYAQLADLVNRAGNALLDLGVRPEQRVLCLLLDSPEFLATFWGAIKIGAIPIPVNTMMRSDDYLYFLDDDGTTHVLKAGPKFEVVSRNPLHEPCRASPAISRGHILIRAEKHLYCIASQAAK